MEHKILFRLLLKILYLDKKKCYNYLDSVLPEVLLIDASPLKQLEIKLWNGRNPKSKLVSSINDTLESLRGKKTKS